MSGWVKLDEGFFMHPKALAAGRDARDVYLAALCWSNQQRTDGVIPSHALPLIASLAGVTDVDQAASRLCEVGLWDNHVDGWQIHDYLDYQQSKEDREAWLKRERDRKQAARDALKEQKSPESVRADKPRNPRNVRSRDVDVDDDVDRRRPAPTPDDDDFETLMVTIGRTLAADGAKRNPTGYARAVATDRDRRAQVLALRAANPERDNQWLHDEHLGRAHPRAPYVPPDPKEVMRAHRGGAA